jgi:hypothetical protein
MLPRLPTILSTFQCAVSRKAPQDAAYEGLDSWSPTFLFMWQVYYDTLIQHSFNMVTLSPLADCKPTSNQTETEIHINILKYLVLIINVWFCLLHIW